MKNFWKVFCVSSKVRSGHELIEKVLEGFFASVAVLELGLNQMKKLLQGYLHQQQC